MGLQSYKIQKDANRHIRLLTHLFSYIMVLFGFSIQIQLPYELKFLYPTTFITFYLTSTFLISKVIQKIHFSTSTKLLITISFVVANTACLYFLSSIKRESEIQQYISKKQSNLKSIIELHLTPGSENAIAPILKELNIRKFFQHNDDSYFSLYSFLGYGYGIIYTDKNEITKPATSPGGSPIIKWIKIDEHWYYYSYFD